MITLNDYLYSGDTIFRILRNYTVDLKKEAKKNHNEIDLIHSNFLIQFRELLEHNDFLTAQSQKIRDFYKYMVQEYPLLAFTFKGRIKSLIRAEEKFNGYIVEYIYDYYEKHHTYPPVPDLREKLSCFRDIIAYRLVISLPKCHIRDDKLREEEEIKYLYRIANVLPVFLEERGFTAEPAKGVLESTSPFMDEAVKPYYRDYISNGSGGSYQSLHITFYDNCSRSYMEVQLRTKKMDDIAEIGAANHQAYEKEQEKVRARREAIPEGECIYFDEAYERGMRLLGLELKDLEVNMFAAANNSLINDGCGLYRGRLILLGKRVDYSGRSVIVVGPELKIYQCGLPKEMAIELFKPFVMKELVESGAAHNIKNAKKMVERLQPEVWDVLEDVIKEHPVMLNRAPTLHRLGIQAFEPILVEGKAIKLHPLVCTAFNADFDGDQMAVHLPLSVEAQAECRFLLLSPNNLLKPSDGGPVAVPSQDMVLGIYYLTQERPGAKGEGKVFKSVNEAILAYENGVVTLHSRIKVRVTKTMPDGTKKTGTVESTLGRFIFNEIIPQDLGFVDREKEGNELVLEVDFHVGKKQLKQILEKVINTHGASATAEVLDHVKSMGYKLSTRAAMTVSISDMTVPPQKPELIARAQSTVDKITRNFKRGLITEEERYKEVVETWKETDDELTEALLTGLDKYNNIFMMADSGARGSDKQIKQLAGMRGLMADTTGHTIELPIKSNFREGLDVLEYFMSAHGARKGMSDTALRTADSGYLTRRLVDVSQDLIIREVDCVSKDAEIPGMYLHAFMDGNEEIESLQERITGRYSCYTICDKDGNVLVKANHMITPKRAEKIMKYGVDENGNSPLKKVKVRTILTCKSHIGICAKCYGANMATGEPVQVGEAVGIIAAQSIGEPGTQLTMRTFHSGGVAGGDITQGLPRVEELFEARKPKGLAIITEIAGVANLNDTKKKREIIVTNQQTGETKTYLIPYGSRIKVQDGAVLEAGDELTEGSVNPHDLLKIKGLRAAQDYMLQEVQRVYRLQGVEINDKHIEVIVRQMLKKIRIEERGDTEFLPGTMVDVLEFNDVNEQMVTEGKEPATGEQIMLGITKASLATDSFLSAASFQETTKVLTEAAIKGKVDHLIGLKENVIIGKLIPAGTGMRKYRDVKLDTGLGMDMDDEISFDDFDMDDDTESEVSAETAETVETEENADETVTVEE